MAVDICDMRPLAATFDIDRIGFELLRHRSRVADFYDDAVIKTVYEPELVARLRHHLMQRVVIFDHTHCSDDVVGA